MSDDSVGVSRIQLSVMNTAVYGLVHLFTPEKALIAYSVNGPRNGFRLIWNRSLDSTSEPKLSDREVHM